MPKRKNLDPLIGLEQIRENLLKQSRLIEETIIEIRGKKIELKGHGLKSSVKLAQNISSKMLSVEDQILKIIKERDKPLKISEIKQALNENGINDNDLIRSANRRLLRKGKLMIVKFDSNNHFAFHVLPEMINTKSQKLFAKYIPSELPSYAKEECDIVNLVNIEKSIVE